MILLEEFPIKAANDFQGKGASGEGIVYKKANYNGENHATM